MEGNWFFMRASRQVLFVAVALGVLLVSAPAAVVVGTTHIDMRVAVRVIGARLLPFWISPGDISVTDQVIVWLVRIPRVILAGVVGAGLAVAGALMQGLFRNPIAESSVLGVGAGAGLGALVAFVSGAAARSAVVMPIGAFVGALLALAIVYALATRGGITRMSTLLLSGIAVAALLRAMSSLLISTNLVSWAVAQQIVFWLWMGGLDNRSWTHVWLSVPFISLAVLIGIYYGRDLDLMAQGEETAAALGVDVEETKRMLMVAAALISGCAVAVAGAVGFVGLIVPHVARLVVGPAHRTLLPASALAGSAFLVVCDLIARTAHPPEEIRLGVITAIMGAPMFLYLLLRRRHRLN
jgi:iron complex transport system permease protein